MFAPEGDDYFHRRPSRPPLAVSHGPRESGRAYPTAQYGNRNSPLHESDSDKGGNQPRRRIAVAVSALHQALLRVILFQLQFKFEADKNLSQCSRCRKRKIKCSGDPGANSNGQGCQNCKSAGIDPGQCQFLRVQ